MSDTLLIGVLVVAILYSVLQCLSTFGDILTIEINLSHGERHGVVVRFECVVEVVGIDDSVPVFFTQGRNGFHA